MFGSETIIPIPETFEATIGKHNYSVVLAEGGSGHLNRDAPSCFKITSSDESVLSVSPASGDIGSASKITIELNALKAGSAEVSISCTFYICSDSGMCTRKTEVLKLTVHVGSHTSTSTYVHTIKLD